jgi:hypothetical protein
MPYDNTSDTELRAVLHRNDPADHDRRLTAAEIGDLRETAIAELHAILPPSGRKVRGWMLVPASVMALLALALSYQMGRNAVLEEQLAYREQGIAMLEKSRLTQQLTASLLQSLSSSDPYQRQRALLIGQTLGLEPVRRVAETQALNERNLETRLAAESVVLGGPDAGVAYQRLSARRQLRIELSHPDLRQLRLDAEGYARGGAANGAPKAVELFNQVIDGLSNTARAGLDANAIAAARLDAERGDAERAALRFMTMLAAAAGEDDGINQPSTTP